MHRVSIHPFILTEKKKCRSERLASTLLLDVLLTFKHIRTRVDFACDDCVSSEVVYIIDWDQIKSLLRCCCCCCCLTCAAEGGGGRRGMAPPALDPPPLVAGFDAGLGRFVRLALKCIVSLVYNVIGN